MGKVVLIGQQDFAAIREMDWFYVDKTALIKECFFSRKYAGRGDLYRVWQSVNMGEQRASE